MYNEVSWCKSTTNDVIFEEGMLMSEHDNRRDHQRIQLKQTISAADENNLILAEINDITVGGISLSAEVGFAQGANFYVLFPGAGKVQENEVQAEVVRCEESDGRFDIAAKFINANQKYLEDAVALIKE